MTSKKISRADISELTVASLPTRPTAKKSNGGGGYTATEMKEAFDRLPLYIIDAFNTLIDDIITGRLLSAIPTGIDGDSTLYDLCASVKNGVMAEEMIVLESTLADLLRSLCSDMERVKAKLGL